MTRNVFIKPSGVTAGLLLLAMVVAPLIAQPASDSRVYDMTREVTLTGAVSGVITAPASGTTWGFHILITTVSGTVDASLGRWGLQGLGGLSLSIGQQVEITGVMTTFNGKQVFVARTVKADGKVYTMRTEHGVPVSPQARQRHAQKGESL